LYCSAGCTAPTAAKLSHQALHTLNLIESTHNGLPPRTKRLTKRGVTHTQKCDKKCLNNLPLWSLHTSTNGLTQRLLVVDIWAFKREVTGSVDTYDVDLFKLWKVLKQDW
jgi:hypothetical protein